MCGLTVTSSHRLIVSLLGGQIHLCHRPDLLCVLLVGINWLCSGLELLFAALLLENVSSIYPCFVLNVSEKLLKSYVVNVKSSHTRQFLDMCILETYLSRELVGYSMV